MPTTDAFADRVFEATLGYFQILSIYLGLRLGLYEALADEPLTADALAARAGIDARYACEWCEQQATTGTVDADVTREPHVFRLRSELAQAQTADPALISGRAALRRLGRELAALPAGEADPCAAYRAYAKAGYPRGPARAARALSDRLDTILTRGMERRIRAAGARMEALGISRADAEAFSSLAD